MWPATLLTTTAAAFGRLVVAGILPSTLLIAAVWSAVTSGAFLFSTSCLTGGAAHCLTPAALLPSTVRVDSPGVLVFVLFVAVLTAMLRSFQIPIVRLFEGYWGRRRPFVALSAARVRTYVERRALADQVHAEAAAAVKAGLPRDLDELPVRRQREALRNAQQSRLNLAWADRQRVRYPPAAKDFLPTALGNALRGAERTAGERYGWSTVATWPRLYWHIPPAPAAAYESITDAIDAAAVFALTFTVIALVTAAAYWDDPALVWIPVVAGVLAFVSYRGAIASAGVQRILQHVAFDLYRFDLVRSLHVTLPDTPHDEFDLAEGMSTFFAQSDPEVAGSYFPADRYDHRSAADEE